MLPQSLHLGSWSLCSAITSSKSMKVAGSDLSTTKNRPLAIRAIHGHGLGRGATTMGLRRQPRD
jgi:hypothetical protein